MHINKAKTKLQNGGTIFGPFVNESRTVGVVKIMAIAGYDFIAIDTEHNMFDMETISSMVQMALACELCPLIRVTDPSYPLIARSLDSGAQGVILPRMETRSGLEDAISFGKYPPVGQRGSGGYARNGYYLTEVKANLESLNQQSMIIAQIETKVGLENAEDIISVPGLDAMLIGPQDLSIALGIPGELTNPLFLETVDRLMNICEQNAVACGIFSNDAEELRGWHEKGMRFLICSSDTNMMIQGAKQDVQKLRSFAQR